MNSTRGERPLTILGFMIKLNDVIGDSFMFAFILASMCEDKKMDRFILTMFAILLAATVATMFVLGYIVIYYMLHINM